MVTKSFLLQLITLTVLLGAQSFAQISSAGSGAWNASATWTGGVVPGPNDNVVINSGHTVNLNISNAYCKDITLSGSLVFATDGTSSGIIITGSVTVNSTGALKASSRNPAGAANSFVEHKVTLRKNFTNLGIVDLRAGSTSGGTSNGANLTLLGDTNSVFSLKNTTYQSSSEEFNAITVNKTNGAKIILQSGNLFMNNSSSVGPVVLTFISGIIETGNNIWIFMPTATAGIVGASPTCYVKGILGRGMNSSGATDKKFEIGDADGYRPVSLRSTIGLTSGHYVYVKLVKANANTGSSVLSGSIDSVSRYRYFQVGYEKGATTGAPDSVTFEQFTPYYNSDDGITQNQTGVMAAYSVDARATWINAGPTNHVADLSNPPTPLQSSTLSPVVKLMNGGTMYVCIAFGAGAVTGPVPTYPNASYGPNVMHKLDFWKAESDSATPLVVWIHGGGLTAGSKADVSLNLVSSLLAKKISVMSINYRLSPEVVVPVHYMDCARAIQWARYNADTLHINPAQIGLGGSSAGGLTSFWLAFHGDLKDPANADPVLRMSTRIRGAACWSGQTTVDSRVARVWIGDIVLQFTSYFGGTIFGLPADSMNTPTAYALMEMASPANYVTADDPPIWMYYSNTATPTTASEAIHHVNFGLRLQDIMNPLGIESTLLTPQNYSGSVTGSAVDFWNTKLRQSPVGVREYQSSVSPDQYQLFQNYPNPFNPSTSIRYSIPADGYVSLKIYDIIGNEIATLVNEVQKAGAYKTDFNTDQMNTRLTSGVYFFKLQSGSITQTKKMILVQ